MSGLNKYGADSALLYAARRVPFVPLAVTVFLALSANALAQMDNEAGTEKGVLEEVVVTAQRRSENILDVPISITAITGDRIEAMGIRTPIEMMAQVPNVSFQLPTAKTGFPIFNIRGVTMLDFTDTNESSVAIYVDDVYLGSPSIQNGQLFDIERAEVLRGPQGTLFGRNATGGLVHFITRKPTEEFEGMVTVGFGKYDDYNVEAVLSGPFGDNVRGRLAVFGRQRDGWQKNIYIGGGSDVGDIDKNVAVRGTLEIDASENLELSASLHYGKLEGENEMRGFFGKGDPLTGEICSIEDIFASKCVDLAATGYFDPYGDPEIVASELPAQQIDNESYGGWFRLEWDLGFATLTSITAYDTVDKFQLLDADVSPAEIYALYFTVEHDQWNQEFRLTGDTDDVNWVAGLYYYQDDRFFTNGFPQLFGSYGSFAYQDIQTWAGFAQATWAVTDTVNLTAGGRYTQDEREASQIATVLGAVPGTDQGFQLFNTSRSFDGDKFTWRLAVDWHLSPEHMLYGSISTGFKSAAFNTLYPGSEALVTTAGPENVTSYEIGVKGSVSSVPLSYNVAAFYTDYKDVQAAGTQIIDGQSVSVLSSIGDADLAGVEAELTAAPADGLFITFGFGYMDAEYITDPDATFNGTLLNGNRPVVTPKYNINGSIRYEYPLANASSLHAMLTYRWADDIFFGPDNLPTEAQSSYGLLNLFAGWTSPSGDFSVDCFVKNATDEWYFTHGIDGNYFLPGAATMTWGMPRTWGVKLTKHF